MADETLRQLLLDAADFINETAEDFHSSNVNHKGSFTDPDDGPHYRRMTELVMRLNAAAALPADDAEPLTDQHIRDLIPASIPPDGCTDGFDDYGAEVGALGTIDRYLRQGQMLLWLNGFPLYRGLMTVGDLRRLLAALKVPTKESEKSNG